MDRTLYHDFDKKVKPIYLCVQGKTILVRKLRHEEIPEDHQEFDEFLEDLSNNAVPTATIPLDHKNYLGVFSRHQDICSELISLATNTEKKWFDSLSGEERERVLWGFYLVNFHFLLAFVV